jgi:hypothetical protein
VTAGAARRLPEDKKWIVADHVPQIDGDKDRAQAFAFAFGYIQALIQMVNREP